MRQQSLRIFSLLVLAQRVCVLVSAFPRGNVRKLAEEWEDRDLGTGKSKSYSAKKQCVREDAGSDGVPIPLLPTQPTSGDVPDIPWLNETNQWQAPGPNDVRSPCPFLNTVANHGLVNRSGKDIDLFNLAQVVSDTFGLSFEFNSIIASVRLYVFVYFLS